MPPACLVQHVRAAVGAFVIDNVLYVGRQSRGGSVDDLARSEHRREETGRERFRVVVRKRSCVRTIVVLHIENRKRQREAATIVHTRLEPQPGTVKADECARRLVAHRELTHSVEVVVYARQTRPESGPQRHLQEEHGLAGAKILGYDSAGNRSSRLGVELFVFDGSRK